MAIVVEDGSGKADANSYASVAIADDYFLLRGRNSWGALSTEAKEASLINATDYLEATYRNAWLGSRVSNTQALSWPRYDVLLDGFAIASNTVPPIVVSACMELALRASSEDLLTDTGAKVIRERVDVLEVEYSEYGSANTRYTFVERLLAPLLASALGGSASVMAVVRS